MALGHSQGNSAIRGGQLHVVMTQSWIEGDHDGCTPPPIISLNMLLYLVTSSYYHALLYYIALHSCGTEQTIDAARLYTEKDIIAFLLAQ